MVKKTTVIEADLDTKTRQTDLHYLEEQLAIDEHALEEGNQAQPELFYKAAKRLALEISRRDAAKTALKESEAEIDIEIREEARNSDTKVTEGTIESRKRVHPKVVEATDALNNCVYNVELWSALKEAYTMRSYALKELVFLHLASYYGDISVQGGNNQLKDRAAQSNREAMNEARRHAQPRYRRDD